MKGIKRIWNRFLDLIAWISQDNARLRKARRLKPEQEIELQRMRMNIPRFR